MIDKKSFSDKQENSMRIMRGKHDKEHPYVMITKSLFRNKNLSTTARCVLAFLLCLPDNWVSHPRQLAQEVGIGKDAMYKALKDLIKEGYAIKKEITAKGKFQAVEYYFFEEPIQKISTVSGNPDTEKPDTENQTLQNKESKEDIPKEDNTPPIPPHPEPGGSMPAKAGEARKKVSPEDWPSEVIETGQAMIETMKSTKPDCKEPASAKMLHSIDLMIRLDKRDVARILRVFRWALADEFWRDKFFKPNPADYLRQKFDQLEAKMNAKPVDPRKIDRRLKDQDGRPIDEPMKDNLF